MNAVIAHDYQPRTNFRARLEPSTGVLHGAGQSQDAFAEYVKAVGPEQHPAVFMYYLGLQHYRSNRLAGLRRYYESYGLDLLPQIGLAFTQDGSPELCYDDAVRKGTHDQSIHALAQDLAELPGSLYVRLGYEFNGHWNGYRQENFAVAWRRVAAVLRDRLGDRLALVWCYAPDGREKNYEAFYPGDEWVDWWGIDLFAPAHFYQEDTISFMKDAFLHQKPMMIGESTPRRIGVLDGQASWVRWFAQYFRFIREQPHVKSFCYINWDWSGYAQWHDWGDARLEANELVRARYVEELSSLLYWHRSELPRLHQPRT